MRSYRALAVPLFALCVTLGLAGALQGCGGRADHLGGPLLVAGFENGTGNDAFVLWDPWLSDMLVRDLWQAPAPVVWSPGRALAVRRRAGSREREAVLAAARDAGASMALFGRVTQEDGGFRLAADLVRTGDGEPVQAVSALAQTPDDLPAAVDSLRDALWQVLQVEPPAPPRPVTELTTADLEAYGEFVAGSVLFDQQRYLAALDRFRRAAEKDVEFALAHYRRTTARMQFVVGGGNEAESFITLAWAKRDHASPRDRQAIEALRDLVFGDSAKAAAAYGDLNSTYPGDPELAYYQGVALSRSGDLDAAAEAFSAAVAAAPDLLPAREALANAHLMEGRWDEARTVAQAGLQLNPADPGLLEAVVSVDLLTGRLDEAESILAEALGTLRDPRLLLARGNLMLLRGEVTAARAHFLEMGSPFSIAFADLYAGNVNAALARFDEETEYQVAAGNRGPAAIGYWFIGMVMAANGNPGVAFEELTNAFNLAPSLADGLAGIGLLAAREGDVERASRALAALRAPEAAAPEEERQRLGLLLAGEIARARGDYDEAVDLLSRAAEQARLRFLGGGLISDRPLLLDALARAQSERGDLESAASTYRQIAGLAGERLHWPWLWMEAHVRLAELAMREGRRDEAGEKADLVRRYWGAAGGQGQPLVDGALDRLQRILPAQ